MNVAHQAQRDFVHAVSIELQRYFHGAHVLEVGSPNINGTVRDFFSNCTYIGVDVAPGKDVDVVCQGQEYDAADETFDQVISCEAMEHNPHWRATFANMARVCKSGGLVLMTCATVGRAEHGTTRSAPSSSPLTVAQGWDYYQNLTKRDFAATCDLERMFSRYHFWTNWSSYDLYFLGLKRSADSAGASDETWGAAIESVNRLISLSNALKIHKYREIAARLGGDRWFFAMRRLIQTLDYIHSA